MEGPGGVYVCSTFVLKCFTCPAITVGTGHTCMSTATLTHRQLYTEAQAAAQAATSWLGSTTAIYDLET